MKKIVRHENGELCLLDTENDECVYNGHENTGPRQNRWLEVYFHPAAGLIDGEEPVWYVAHMTHWQGETSYLEVVNKDKAAEIVGSNLDDLTEDDLRFIEEIGLIKFSELK